MEEKYDLFPEHANIEIDKSEGQEKRQRLRIRIFKWQSLTAALCIVVRAFLLYLYAACLFDERAKHQTYFSLAKDAVPLLYLVLETAFSFYRFNAQHLHAMLLGPKARFRPRLRIVGDSVPTIDVLIFYCGEEFNVLQDTVAAACSIDYPRSRYRVVVLDDSASVSEEIQALQLRFPNLFYSARGNRTLAWHKAGNINHGLKYVASLPGGPNEFVAGLDVDMIPEPDWLRRVVPHFINDPDMGLVSPNQRFYNVPPKDPLGQLLQFDQLQQVRNPRRDFGGLALGGSTGWLARRAALDKIGGFAEDGIAEDYMTCVDLKEAGWKVALLDENMQWGLAPDSFNGHFKQTQRWVIAILSFYKSLHGSERPRNRRATKFVAELSTAAYVVAMCLCYFGLPLMVLSGQPFVSCVRAEDLRRLMQVALADFTVHSIHGILESATADFTTYAWHEASHLWHAPCYVSPVMRRWFPDVTRMFVGKVSSLTTAGSAANRSSEATCRRPWDRLRLLISEGRYISLHFWTLICCFAGLVMFSIQLCGLTGSASKSEVFRFAIQRLGWPPVFFLWTSVFRNALFPLWYALYVPPRPSREDFLVRDEKSGLAYPIEKSKSPVHRQVNEWHMICTLLYFVAVSVVSYSLE